MPASRSSSTLDVRGLACPLPAVKARAALRGLAPAAALVVLATDPEAPVDVAAAAADAGRSCDVARAGDHWRLTIGPRG